MLGESAFLEQLEMLKDGLYRFARRHLNFPSDIDDVFGDAVLAAWTQRGQFAEGTSFRAWIYRILLNKIYVANRRRALERKAARDPGLQPGETEPDEEPAYAVFGERLDDVLERCEDDLRAAILRLNEKEREVFLLLSLGQLSYAEIAAATESPKGTVITRLTRARAKLRAALTQRSGNPDSAGALSGITDAGEKV